MYARRTNEGNLFAEQVGHHTDWLPNSAMVHGCNRIVRNRATHAEAIRRAGDGITIGSQPFLAYGSKEGHRAEPGTPSN
jgi:hypothetical protein